MIIEERGRYANAKEIDGSVVVRGVVRSSSIDRSIGGILQGYLARRGHNNRRAAACGTMKYDKSPGNAECKSENFPSYGRRRNANASRRRGRGSGGLAAGGRGRSRGHGHKFARFHLGRTKIAAKTAFGSLVRR